MNTRDKTIIGFFGIIVLLLLLALFYVYNQTRQLDSRLHQIARQTKLTAKMSDVHYEIDAHVKNQGLNESHFEKRFTAMDNDTNKLTNELETIRKEVRALDNKIAGQISAQNAIQVAQIAARTSALISPITNVKDKTTFVSDNVKISVGEPVIVESASTVTPAAAMASLSARKHMDRKESKFPKPVTRVEHKVERGTEHKTERGTEHKDEQKKARVKFVEHDSSTPSPVNVRDDLHAIIEERESDLDSSSSTTSVRPRKNEHFENTEHHVEHVESRPIIVPAEFVKPTEKLVEKTVIEVDHESETIVVPQVEDKL